MVVRFPVTGVRVPTYKTKMVKGRKYLLHRWIAEQALGKPLPDTAVVHHVDGNRHNNANNNLVICEDDAYHALLHNRQRALDATGNVNSVRCGDCSRWINPDIGHPYCAAKDTNRNGRKPTGFHKRPLFFGRSVYDARTRRTIPEKPRDVEACKSAYANRFTKEERPE